jgi:5-methylcytosine-specific restriction endonuclease McrA
VLEAHGFACRYCGRKAPEVELHVDHVDPVSRGGSDDESNLVAACVDCNLGKSDRTLRQEVRP